MLQLRLVPLSRTTGPFVRQSRSRMCPHVSAMHDMAWLDHTHTEPRCDCMHVVQLFISIMELRDTGNVLQPRARDVVANDTQVQAGELRELGNVLQPRVRDLATVGPSSSGG